MPIILRPIFSFCTICANFINAANNAVAPAIASALSAKAGMSLLLIQSNTGFISSTLSFNALPSLDISDDAFEKPEKKLDTRSPAALATSANVLPIPFINPCPVFSPNFIVSLEGE